MLYSNSLSTAQSSQNTPQFQNTLQFNATQSLVRLGQVDPAQYASNQEFTTWAYSACSTAAMTEVFNAYGHHYRITDVLKVEAQLGEITPQLGLLEEVGIQQTAAQFGFKITMRSSDSLKGKSVVMGLMRAPQTVHLIEASFVSLDPLPIRQGWGSTR